MRKVLISIVLLFLVSTYLIPANALDVSKGQDDVWSWQFATNDKTSAAVWFQHENPAVDVHNYKLYVNTKVGKHSWSKPQKLFTTHMDFYPQVEVLSNNRIFIVFWADDILYYSISNKYGKKFSKPKQVPQSADFTFYWAFDLSASGNRITIIGTEISDETIHAYSWDLVGSKWTRKFVADVFSEDFFEHCDALDTENCFHHISISQVVTNSKGQQNLVFTTYQQKKNLADYQNNFYIFDAQRNNVSSKWKPVQVIDETSLTSESQEIDSEYWCTSSAITTKGKVAIACNKAINGELNQLVLATSHSFGGEFTFPAQNLFAESFLNKDGFFQVRKEKIQFVWANFLEGDSAPNVLIGYVDDLSAATVVAESQVPLGFYYVNGNPYVVSRSGISFDGTIYGMKFASGSWKSPEAILQARNSDLTLFTYDFASGGGKKTFLGGTSSYSLDNGPWALGVETVLIK